MSKDRAVRRLVAAASLCLALAGVVGPAIPVFAAPATAPTAPMPAPQAGVQDLAKGLGVKPQALDAAIRATLLQRWNEAATANHLSQDALREGQTRIAKAPINVVLDVAPGAGQGPLSVAAKALGISVPEVLTGLRQGKNLTQLAEAHGKSPQTLRQALVTAAAIEVSWQAAERGWSVEQQQKAIARLTQQIDHWMTAPLATDGGPRPHRTHSLRVG